MPDSRLEHELGPEDKVFFLHIPKTGGTTLLGYLQGRFDLDAIFPPHSFDHEMLATPPAELNQYGLFRGHFPYDVMRQLLDRAPVCFTVLRQPVDRFVSNYAYWQQEHQAVGQRFPADQLAAFLGLSLDEFVQSPRLRSYAELSNLQARLLSERFEITRHAQGCRAVKVEPADVGRAQAALDACAVVGLTERFDESLCLLAFTFGWPPPVASTPANVTRGRQRLNQLAPETLRRMEAMNQLDLEVYAYGQALFERRLAAMTETLLERYGTRAETGLPRPLPLETLVRLLEQHYEQRYAQRRYPPLSQVRLSVSDPVWVTNWYPVEKNSRHGPFRWTGPGTSSTLDLPLTAEHDLQIKIGVLQAIAPEVLQGAELRVNNRPLSLLAYREPDGTTLLAGRIPRQALQTQRPFSRLELVAGPTRTPHSLNASNLDERPLGLAVTWIELAPARG